MPQNDSDQLTPRMRGRLLLGVPILAVFAVLTLINAGVQVHTYFEARESIAYHEKKRAEDSTGTYSPWRRVEDMEADRDQAVETFFLSFGMFVFFAGLVYLGGRKWMRSQRHR